IFARLPVAVLNGHPKERIPNNVNISIPGIDGETAVIYLSERGIYCSTGSACTARSLEPSHVIAALGKPEEYTRGSLRFTLGRFTLKEDITYAVKTISEVVGIL
ncbi:MAG: cysteine desulfurase, partial [Parcubacteria group bacterium Gr01-1014_33]